MRKGGTKGRKRKGERVREREREREREVRAPFLRILSSMSFFLSFRLTPSPRFLKWSTF
jgi:hypothetical protein